MRSGHFVTASSGQDAWRSFEDFASDCECCKWCCPRGFDCGRLQGAELLEARSRRLGECKSGCFKCMSGDGCQETSLRSWGLPYRATAPRLHPYRWDQAFRSSIPVGHYSHAKPGRRRSLPLVLPPTNFQGFFVVDQQRKSQGLRTVGAERSGV